MAAYCEIIGPIQGTNSFVKLLDDYRYIDLISVTKAK